MTFPGPDASYAEIKAWQDSLRAPAPAKAKPPAREKLKAPFPYFGGKSRAADLVWSRLGHVVNYVEPFFGSGAMLLSCPEDMRPRVETVNDINGFVSNFWRAVKAEPEAVASVADYPVIETDLHARHRWLLGQAAGLRERLDTDPDYFDAKIAAWWVWGASAWIGSGWCEEGRAPSEQLPSIGTRDHSRGREWGRGIHAAGMREPSRQLPDLGAKAPEGRTQEACGRGIHAAGARAPSRQLPDLGGATSGGQVYPNHGKGTHGLEARTALYDIFARLSERLRHVRVACGDFARILTPAVTYRHGLTAVFLDPPYDGYEHLYGAQDEHPEPISARVRAWALEVGQREDMRIAVCGYEGEHTQLEEAGWSVVPWKAKGGYGNQRTEGQNVNARRERIWFSPHCLPPTP